MRGSGSETRGGRLGSGRQVTYTKAKGGTPEVSTTREWERTSPEGQSSKTEREVSRPVYVVGPESYLGGPKGFGAYRLERRNKSTGTGRPGRLEVSRNCGQTEGPPTLPSGRRRRRSRRTPDRIRRGRRPSTEETTVSSVPLKRKRTATGVGSRQRGDRKETGV